MSCSLRIVIADDEADLRDYLHETLSVLGHEVVGVAATGRELVEQARTTQPDLVITSQPPSPTVKQRHAFIR